MAFRIEEEDELGALSEINVTPLVDVMLVLLIIFMITAPMMTHGLDVELPRAEGEAFETTSNKPATISIDGAGQVFLDGESLGKENLESVLGTALRGRSVRRALLEADTTVPYGTVVQVIDIMNRSGVEQLGMLTQPGERSDARRRR